ncbi:hypothetical protein [Planctomyces sp. SH-PL14]|uniref:hypothetical protein n=1 Tax=Planctomyces sp. SH-PL14 TaxID=1632864 RepID=UPI00078D68BB|nr:hypothetical protein [Planctomyces sp. SH-PL14]AMV18836.1 hypothetical protein VT03_13180 [Planctomyces sp. SH-PL14]
MATFDPDEKSKVTRRAFLQHSTAALSTASAVALITLKTDALARPVIQPLAVRENGMGAMPYPYMNP